MSAGPQAGDKIDALARHYSNQANAGPFMKALRARKVTLNEYKSFICKLYPLVVGFNGGLIHSLARIDELQKSAEALELVEELLNVDHVRHAHRVQALAARLRATARKTKLPTLRALAGQLKEEQEHNDYYRQMLEIYGIDHEAVYTAFETYLNALAIEERDCLTQEVIAATQKGRTPDAFPDTCFSQYILALYHYLLRVANDPAVKFAVYNALQSAIEFSLVKVVSESVFPGVAGTPDHPQLNLELVPGAGMTRGRPPGSSLHVPLSIKWWDEHAEYGQGGKIELQHVRYGREHLNRNLVEEADVKEALKRVDEVLCLLAAAVA